MRLAWLIVGFCAACGGSSSGTPDAAASPDAVTIDAPPPRMQLAAGGVQLLVTGPRVGLQITPADLATDADVIEIHQEFYGVPWDAFLADTPPPAAWSSQMQDLANSAHETGKPIFLSISMLNGGRDHLSDDLSGSYGARCPDVTDHATAYLRYAAYMQDLFHPQWLNYGIEINLFFEHCPSQIATLTALANATYHQVKAADPSLVAFPSIQIDHLYGYDQANCPDQTNRAACFDANYAQLAGLERDRFAMSTYPIPLGGQTLAELPADWFTRGADRGGERALVAETGIDSTALVVKPRDSGCATVFTQTPADAGAYLARLLGDASAAHMDLVTWWSDRDLVVDELMTDCPCTFDATWCAVLDAFRGPPTTSGPDTQLLGELGLKVFGTMGLRTYAGAEKPFYSQWSAFRAP